MRTVSGDQEIHKKNPVRQGKRGQKMRISAVKKVFLFDKFDNLQTRGKKMKNKSDNHKDKCELSEEAKKLRSENFLPPQVRFSRSPPTDPKKNEEKKEDIGRHTGNRKKQIRIVSRYAVGAE